MPSETEPLCELWEEVYPTPLHHSRLFSLEPLGLGTPFIESLTSYITRLADAHSVHLLLLIQDELFPQLFKLSHGYDGFPSYNDLTAFWKRSARLNGTSATTHKWVQTLEFLTGRSHLQVLTMLPWARAISHLGLYRKTQAWCPVCYEEWRKAEEPIYQPLLWALEVIKVCPLHRVQLQVRCPFSDCRKSFTFLASRAQVGYCPYCQRWLAPTPVYEIKDQEPSVIEQEWQNWVGKVVGEMLAVTPRLPVVPCQDAFATIITSQLRHVFKGKITALARAFQVHRRTALDWMRGQQVPQLLSFLQVCACLGTTPTRFFQEGPLEKALTLEQANAERLPEKKQKKQFRKFPFEQLQAALEAILRDDKDPPPSMHEVAGRLGYDQNQLYRYFPELSRQISERWFAYQKAQKEARVKKMCEEVDQVIEMVHLQGYYPGSRRIRKLLRKPGNMKQKEVAATWRKRVRELGWK